MHLVVSGLALLAVYWLYQIGKAVVEIFLAVWPFLLFAGVIALVVFVARHAPRFVSGKRSLYRPADYEPRYDARAAAEEYKPTPMQSPNWGVPSAREFQESSQRSVHAFMATADPHPVIGASAVGATRAATELTRGLIIRAEPLEQILSGRKTWEMRGTRTKIRGPIALIQKGSGKIYGVAEIVDSRGPLTRSEIEATVDKHAVPVGRIDEVLRNYEHAWVLANVKRLRRPVDYVHRSGAVKFVTLDGATVNKVQEQL